MLFIWQRYYPSNDMFIRCIPITATVELWMSTCYETPTLIWSIMCQCLAESEVINAPKMPFSAILWDTPDKCRSMTLFRQVNKLSQSYVSLWLDRSPWQSQSVCLDVKSTIAQKPVQGLLRQYSLSSQLTTTSVSMSNDLHSEAIVPIMPLTLWCERLCYASSICARSIIQEKVMSGTQWAFTGSYFHRQSRHGQSHSWVCC